MRQSHADTPDTTWMLLRWRIALWVLVFGARIAPDGTAKDRYHAYMRQWCDECREAWKLRYGE